MKGYFSSESKKKAVLGWSQFCENWCLKSSLLLFVFSHLTMDWWNCISEQDGGVGQSPLWPPLADLQVTRCSMRAAFVLSLVDCDRPADRTENPDSHRSGCLRFPQAAVHPDQPRWSWNWQGDPGFSGDLQCQAAHIHHLGQPCPWQNPGETCFSAKYLSAS